MLGKWDNSKCIYALLPACLKLGNQSADIGYPDANYDSAGFCPVYNGPAAENTIIGKTFQDIYYTDGKLDTSYVGVVRAGNFYTSYELPFSETSKWSLDAWFKCETPRMNPSAYYFGGSSYYGSIPAYNSWFNIDDTTFYMSSALINGTDFGFETSRRSGYTPDLNLLHVTVVKQSDGYLKNYLDGIECDDILYHFPYNFAVVSGGYFIIHAWNGNIFNSTLYNDTLTGTEILTLHNLGYSLGG